MLFADGVALSSRSLGRVDQGLAVAAGREHAAALGIPEEIEQRVGGRHRLGDPSRSRRVASASETNACDQRGVVGGEREVAPSTVASATSEATVRRRGEGCRAGTRRSRSAASSQSRRCVAAAASASAVEHQRVPLGEHLVVEPGAHAPLAGVEERLAGLLDRRGTDAGRRAPVGAGCCEPSKFPAFVMPYHSIAAGATSPSTASISSMRPDVEASSPRPRSPRPRPKRTRLRAVGDRGGRR